MSLTSRKLLTKLYIDDQPIHKKAKQKSTLERNLFNKSKKLEYMKSSNESINRFNKNDNNGQFSKIKEDENSNKFPIIPKFNLNNIKTDETSKNNEIKDVQINKSLIKLNYKLIESTTEDKQFPLRELKKGLNGSGWQSGRFCQYPQYIYIQFIQPTIIKKIELVLHEKNIPTIIKFYSFTPKSKDENISNYQSVNYEFIGYIKTDSNEKTNYQLRESRKINVNIKSLFFKIEFERNHLNNYNLFNQVGLMKLEFIGEYLPYVGGKNENNNLILKTALKRNFLNDGDLENICGRKLTELKRQMIFNIQIEDYRKCKEIKKKIEQIRLYGKKIFDLESEKNIAINNGDLSKAIEMKNLIDKLKINIHNIDNINSPSSMEKKMLNDRISRFSNIPMLDLNINQNNAKSYDFNKLNDSNSNKINNSLSFASNNNYTVSQDVYVSYDEKILPNVLKKLNNEETQKEEVLEKGELEQASPEILKEFDLINKAIGEENLRKIFSEQILWKEEGLILLMEKIDKVLKDNHSNEMVSNLMKISLKLIEDNSPFVVIKGLEILIAIFEFTKKNNIKLNVDKDIKDNILLKVKKKLEEVNSKIRDKSVSLFCCMLTSGVYNYNNLVSELVNEEIKEKNKNMVKSSCLILGKLDIFINLFNNFEEAVKMKITNKNSFPSNLVMDFLIINISNNKAEIRNKARKAINLFSKIFEIEKYKKNLEKIEEKELVALIEENPNLQKYFPNIKINNNKKTNILNSKNIFMNNKEMFNLQSINQKLNINKNWKKSKRIFLKSKFINSNFNSKTDINSKKEEVIEEKDNNDNNNKNSLNDKTSIKKVKCNHCKMALKENEVLANHYTSNCPMFTKCEKCNMNLEVKKLNNHKIEECKFKNEYKLYNNCKESILKKDYDLHIKNKCNLNKGFVKCPLCHQDIEDKEDGFYQHLVVKSCPSQIIKP